MTNKEAIERMLPKKTDDIGFEDADWFRGYNVSLSDTAEKLSKQMVGVEEIKQIILKSRMGKYIPLGFYDEWNDLALALTKEFIILKRKNGKEGLR